LIINGHIFHQLFTSLKISVEKLIWLWQKTRKNIAAKRSLVKNGFDFF
jgi:hypothetical protein